jgi:deoxycytidylate deaminase
MIFTMTDIMTILNPKILDLIDKACEISSKSIMKFKHGAILLRNRRDIISTSYNSYPHHAEANVIRKSAKSYNINKCIDSHNGATVLVVRTSASGDWCNSKPCINCVKSMIKAKVRYVIYTTGTKELYRMERPIDIITSHISSGTTHNYNHN